MKRIVRECLFEEKLGTYPGFNFDVGKIAVYKNPPDIKRMSAWARAFHDSFGNFYIADAENETLETDYIDTDHTELMKFVRDKIPSVTTDWIDRAWRNGIAWQRLGKSYDFYLSESYMSVGNHRADIEEIASEMKNFYTPRSVTFHFEGIDHSAGFKWVPPL